MDFNLKILKYNLSLALALSGVYYYKNPQKLNEHPQIVKESLVKSVQALKDKTTLGNKLQNNSLRKTASVPEERDKNKGDFPNLFSPPKEPGMTDEDLENYKKTTEVEEDNFDSKESKKIIAKKEDLDISKDVIDLEKKENLENSVIGGVSQPVTNTNSNTNSSTSSSRSSCSKPLAPSNLVIVLSSNQPSLSWTSGNLASSYNIFRGTITGNLTLLVSGVTSTTYLDTSATSGEYFYKISSSNNCGDSTTSSSEESIYIPTSFTDNFSFNSSLVYNSSQGGEITLGVARLEVSSLVSGKTLNGSGTVQESVLDNYTFLDNNLVLSDDKVQLTSGNSGTYISEALDGKNSSINWTGFSFYSSTPYGKEISTSIETGYDYVSNFSEDLISLWHFNESSYNNTLNEVKDAKGVIHGSTLGTLSVSEGKLNKALSFNGGSNYVVINDHADLDNKNALTISTWVYPTVLDGNPRGIISKRVNSTATDHAYSLFFYTGNRLFVDIHSTNNRFFSNTVFIPNNWYHIVVVFDGTEVAGSRVKVYINGQLDIIANESSTSIPATSSNLYVGALNLAYGIYYHGLIDETALWSRALPIEQVEELYIRGSTRVKYQIRTCDDISGRDCSGNISDWVGPDGTSITYFSELNNNSLLNSTGVVNDSIFNKNFSFFTNGLTTWLATVNNSLNQFIQYKAVLETDSGVVFPDFKQVSFSPQVRYPTSAIVYSLASAAINFNSLTGLQITDNCGDANGDTLDNDIKYDLSFDGGVNYYSYNLGTWSLSTDHTTANTKSQLEAITDFSNIPTGNSLMIRVFLSSNGLTSCEVDNIQVQGLR